MEKEKIKVLYFDKIAEINDYNKAYYDQDNPIISDYKYDRLKIEILNLEKKYKFLKSKLSPTKTVGYKSSNRFKNIKHKIPMLSLSKAFSKSAIELTSSLVAPKLSACFAKLTLTKFVFLELSN